MLGIVLAASMAATLAAPAAVAGVCADPSTVAAIAIEPDHRIGDLPTEITIRVTEREGALPYCGTAVVQGVSVSGTPVTELGPFRAGVLTLDGAEIAGDAVTVTIGDTVSRQDLRRIPGIASILPPLFAIVLAVVTRQALIALFGGIWLGGLFLTGFKPLSALLTTFDDYLVSSVANREHAAIILFTFALGGIVGILSRSGATRSLVDVVAKRATTRRSGLLTAWAAGLVVFFDDYANCLLVGGTVRPFTDRLRISREKLSYIVDSTAAPIATIAIISTWVGFQVGLFDEVLGGGAGYAMFLEILPYSFYSILTIAFVFTLAVTGRDFGPMWHAERRALATGQLIRDGAKPLMDASLAEPQEGEAHAPWGVACAGIGSIITIVIVGLYATGSAAAGEGASLRQIVASADPYAVLLWASFGGSLVTAIIVLGGRWVSLSEITDAWVAGVRSMMMAVLILVLAWAIGDLCKNQLHTGEWLLSNLSPSPALLPVLTFLAAGVVALSTGSSFSTMAIMVPIAAPMAMALTGDASVSASAAETIRHGTLAAILSGAVFGDHCSPISDTTIMSSMASASDHIDHVRTQLPYALVVAGVAALVGFLPAGFGISPLITLPIGLAMVFAIVRFVGKPV